MQILQNYDQKCVFYCFIKELYVKGLAKVCKMFVFNTGDFWPSGPTGGIKKNPHTKKQLMFEFLYICMLAYKGVILPSGPTGGIKII